MKNLFTVLLFLLVPLFSFGQLFESGKISPYTALLLSTIEKENITDEESLTEFKKQFAISSIKEENYVHAFVKIDENADLSLLEEHGVKINTLISDIITVQIPIHKLETVAQLGFVQRLEIGTPVQKRMDKARVAGVVNKMHAGEDLPNPFTGKDVIVGIIDNGFEYGHINYYTSDASELRVKRVWNQNATSGTKPNGFSYGAEYTTFQTITGAPTDNSSETHGTHVAGIAAGADKNNGFSYYGVAPESDIVLVSFDLQDNSTNNVSLLDGINYIYNYASSVNKPAVVNMSLGTHLGPHDGTSLFDQATDKLQGAGRLLVGAVGNEGNEKLHISKTFTAGADTLKSFFTVSLNKSASTDIWGDVNKSFKGRVVVYNTSTKKIVYQTPEFDASVLDGVTYTLTSSDGASGEIYVYTARDRENNRPNAFVQVKMTSINTNHHLGVIITGAGTGTVHGWADAINLRFTDNGVSGWTNGNGEYSAGEIGGTGKKIISVGAYTNTAVIGGGNIASFSSRGSTLDGRMKPDITAPGTAVTSSYSRSKATTTYNTVNGTRYYYGSLQGTSMAAPFVTGVLATWLQAKKDLTPEEARSVLQRTAITDSYTATGGSNTWGYGKINAYEGLKECIRLEDIKDNTGTPDIINYPNPTTGELTLRFLYNDTDVKLSVYNSEGKNVYIEGFQEIRKAQEIPVDLAHIARGIYFIQVVGKEKKVVKKMILLD